MDYREPIRRKPNPRTTSSIISKIFFLYVLKLYKKGFSKDLEENELYEVPPVLKAKKLGNKLEKEWKNQKFVSLKKLLWNSYGFKLLLFGIAEFVVEIITILIRPYALSKLLAYFQETQTNYSRNNAYFYCAILVGSILFQQIFKNNFYLLMMQFGSQIRIGLCSLLYRKALKLKSSNESGDISIGKIVTLITKDIFVFEMYIKTINEIWISVIKTLVISYLLFNNIGHAAFTGIILLIFLNLPFQFYIGSKMTDLKIKMCQKTDARIQITQETLSAMRIIKMYTWENIFQSKILTTRKLEVNLIYKLFFLRFTALGLGGINSQIALYLMLLTLMWQGNYLTADLVYYIVDHFGTLEFTLSHILPAAVYGLCEVQAALQRIESVLKASEIQNKNEKPTVFTYPKINLNNTTLTLHDKLILNKINLKLEQGLTIITGIVGSGKSSVLKTILNEYQLQSGSVTVNGTVSYASQEPWLFPSTIKQNIVFSEEYNEKRYQRVLKICALVHDIELLQAGDCTIVEDRGNNLSKGQQIRINLARAVYRNSDIYLLDDCLATLDTNVSAFIFKECIKRFLKNKAVLFVTHNTKYLNEADCLAYIENGQLHSKPSLKDKNIDVIKDKNTLKLHEKQTINQKEFNEENSTENTELLSEKTKKQVYQETKQTGVVSLKVYKNYIKLGGGFIAFICVISTFGLTQFISSKGAFVLKDWINLEEKLLNISLTTNSSQELDEQSYKRDSKHQIYGFLTVATGIVHLLRAFSMFIFARKACLKLHKLMINNIINCAMSYFDNNFIGNMLNRFSKDLATVDESIPFILFYACQVVFILWAIILTIMITDTDFILPTIFFCVILGLIRNGVMRTSRSLKRLDSTTRSPIVGYLNSTLEGLTTIRAFKSEHILRDEFDRHLDLYTSAYYTLFCSVKGLGVLIDISCDFFLVFVILKFLWGNEVSLAGTVGLGITQTTRLSEILQWGIQQFTDLENQMTSVERVLEYTEIKTESKQGLEIENWPKSGEIIYENVSLSYSNSETPVLKNLNFTIKPSEKIGIVGRTGAGKSSIIASLFRLYEVEGRILIDGIDTKTLSLDFLRKNISIIPQDPVLFTGTIRENIDPLNSFSDEEIWNAIEIANLKPLVPSLSYKITDSGANFSIGQRQLICLARACVLRNKIVVLDEATANMDEESDTLICETIKNKFKNSTVMTIAHKLSTIMESSRIMVLDKGKIKEFDSPQNLLQNQNGLFYQMAQKDNII